MLLLKMIRPHHRPSGEVEIVKQLFQKKRNSEHTCFWTTVFGRNAASKALHTELHPFLVLRILSFIYTLFFFLTGLWLPSVI